MERIEFTDDEFLEVIIDAQKAAFNFGFMAGVKNPNIKNLQEIDRLFESEILKAHEAVKGIDFEEQFNKTQKQ